jgi:hypothetical protein
VPISFPLISPHLPREKADCSLEGGGKATAGPGFLWWDWGLNLRLYPCKACTVPREPHLQSILLWFFWRWAGWRSSSSGKRACLATVRPWVQTLVPPKQKTTKYSGNGISQTISLPSS